MVHVHIQRPIGNLVSRKKNGRHMKSDKKTASCEQKTVQGLGAANSVVARGNLDIDVDYATGYWAICCHLLLRHVRHFAPRSTEHPTSHAPACQRTLILNMILKYIYKHQKYPKLLLLALNRQSGRQSYCRALMYAMTPETSSTKT